MEKNLGEEIILKLKELIRILDQIREKHNAKKCTDTFLS